MNIHKLDYRRTDTGEVVWLYIRVDHYEHIPDPCGDGELYIEYEIVEHTDANGLHTGRPSYQLLTDDDQIQSDLSRLILQEHYPYD